MMINHLMTFPSSHTCGPRWPFQPLQPGGSDAGRGGSRLLRNSPGSDRDEVPVLKHGNLLSQLCPSNRSWALGLKRKKAPGVAGAAWALGGFSSCHPYDNLGDRYFTEEKTGPERSRSLSQMTQSGRRRLGPEPTSVCWACD